MAVVTRCYGAVYYSKVDFDFLVGQVGRASWIWLLLQDLAAESAVGAIASAAVRSLRAILQLLASNAEATRILSKAPKQTSTADIRRLFRISEDQTADVDTAPLARGRAMLRSFIFARAHKFPFAEQVDRQRVRYRPRLPTQRGAPRPLISDLHDITDENSSVPVGALAANTAKQLVDAVKARAEYDLKKIREACIADMEAAAELRRRVAELRRMRMPGATLAIIRDAMRDCRRGVRILRQHQISVEQILIGVLKVIDSEALAKNRSWSYSVPFSKDVRCQFLMGIASFKSRRLLEIEYLACVEELFAAFHLLQTYVSWNWDAVSSLQACEIDLSKREAVILQSYKSKTDDDTPVESIDLEERGVRQAVELLLWNRKQLVALGYLDLANQSLWNTRSRAPGLQREGYFHPVQRLKDFIQRHGLARYTLEQVRGQVLFSVSLRKGGIEAARLKGGHRDYGPTQRYVGNIVQDRISSALNLEFSKRLEAEIVYLHHGGARRSSKIKLLRPIGDGSSCIDPGAPPAGWSGTMGSCDAVACHANGGCPNRRIVIDDNRVEEVLRLNRYYTDNWQRLMQENADRFVAHTVQHMAFNAALLLALQRGPYAARLMHIKASIGTK